VIFAFSARNTLFILNRGAHMKKEFLDMRLGKECRNASAAAATAAAAAAMVASTEIK
jgi:hypothetical protein